MSDDINLVTTEQRTTVVVETQPNVLFVQTGVQGPAGPSAHGELSGLALDQHPQYHTDARGDARYAPIAKGVTNGDNHDHAGGDGGQIDYASLSSLPTLGTAAATDATAYDPAGAAAAAQAASTPVAHATNTSNPHSVTATQVGADATGTAASAVSAHAGGSGVHSLAGVTGLQTALDSKSETTHDHAASYAPIAKGVTNGDSHDHAGGDGAQIAYSGLSGLPTLGTAAATDATAYDPAGAAAAAQSTAIAACPAETASTLGALVAGSTEHTTLADTDKFSLSVSSVAKWLSWANLKAALHGIFARLGGVAGGQTLIGGTDVADSLTLSGTADVSAKITVSKNGIAIGKDSTTSDVTPPVSASLWRPTSHTKTINTDNGVANRVVGNMLQYAYNQSAASAKGAVNCYSELVTGDEQTYATTGFLYNNYSYTEIFGTKARSTVYNAYFRAIYSGGANGTCSYLAGIESNARHSGVGTVTAINSLAGNTNINGGGTATRAWGTEGIVTVSSASTATNAIAIGSKLTNASGCKIINAYGLQIAGPDDVWSNAGEIINCYPIYVGNGSNIGTNKWSIYDDSAANKYFKGSVGIGNTVPTAKLDVMSTTEQFRAGYDASNYVSLSVSSIGIPTWAPTGSGQAQVFVGDIRVDKTVTAAGTTGDQTINKTVGSVNFAAAASSLVVTNSRVGTSSIIHATVATNDSTMKSVVCVAASGSFTIIANAAATAETRVNFVVFN